MFIYVVGKLPYILCC